jgi:hypothetical protein
MSLQCSGSGSIALTGALGRLPWCVPQRNLGLAQRLISLVGKSVWYIQEIVGSSPTSDTKRKLAQLVEHQTIPLTVTGSIPVLPPTDPALGMGHSCCTRGTGEIPRWFESTIFCSAVLVFCGALSPWVMENRSGF